MERFFNILIKRIDTGSWKYIVDKLKHRSMHLYDQTVTEKLAKDIKNENYELYVYTVNSVEVAGKLYSMGVDGIFTDMPDIFFKILLKKIRK